MTKEEMKAALESELKAFTENLGQYANKADIDKQFEAFEEKLNDLNMGDKLKELTDAVEKQGELLNKMKDKEKVKTTLGELEQKKDEIKELYTGKIESVTIKALTNRASVSDNTQSYFLPDIGELPKAQLNALNVFPQVGITDAEVQDGYISYLDWDADTSVRAAAMIAEGGTFPESTAKWEEKKLKIQKIGDTLIMTEEFASDMPKLARQLDMYTVDNIDIRTNDQILNGDGTSSNLTGLFASANTYTATNEGLGTARIPDLVAYVKTAITSAYGGKYRPDVVFMNSADILKYKVAKDSNGQYIIPAFYDINGNQIDAMTVIEDNDVTANTLVVGDRRKATLYVREGIELRKGYQGDQFAEDKITLKARKRVAFLVREVDKTGWLKVESISAALTDLAS